MFSENKFIENAFPTPRHIDTKPSIQLLLKIYVLFFCQAVMKNLLLA